MFSIFLKRNNMGGGSLLVIIIFMFFCGNINAKEFGFIQFKHYDASEQVLTMNIVTPTVNGEVFIRPNGGYISKVDVVMLERLFTLKFKMKCEELKNGADIYFLATEKQSLKAKVPAQNCARNDNENVDILIVNGVCTIKTNGNSLWRAAIELGKRNGLSVYQNVYGIFIANRAAFIGEDIHKLNKTSLVCPENRSVELISPIHAEQLFKESILFK
ncbi:hypothetical protein [Aeromonas sp. SG16]|uniref:hypothetical protein n=1 Tax=Aeromonas sp. SG16 TaxID=2950548 RepID=UPI00210AF529|nr:hypothetical protein [Aeromonas sp. SG16]MCQ4054426.1 hypothetical protein [Aeromonas sp. SG16]